MGISRMAMTKVPHPVLHSEARPEGGRRELLGAKSGLQAVDRLKWVEGTRVWKVYSVLEQRFSDGTRMVESSGRPKRHRNERLGGRMMSWKLMTVMSMATTQRPGRVRMTRMIRWKSKH
jgi:hypothetical protein